MFIQECKFVFWNRLFKIQLEVLDSIVWEYRKQMSISRVWWSVGEAQAHDWTWPMKLYNKTQDSFNLILLQKSLREEEITVCDSIASVSSIPAPVRASDLYNLVCSLLFLCYGYFIFEVSIISSCCFGNTRWILVGTLLRLRVSRQKPRTRMFVTSLLSPVSLRMLKLSGICNIISWFKKFNF